MQIAPISHPLNAIVQVPGSKSLTNRALMIAAMAEGCTRLTNALFSDDSRYFVEALQTLGFQVDSDAQSGEIMVTGLGGRLPVCQATLFIGNAGTAARFLSAFLTLGSGEYILDGDERMRARPIADLVEALNRLGSRVKAGPTNCPPVVIQASGLPGGKTTISGNISSQFLSALLMVAPYARQAVEISLATELSSKPYVDMTLAVMEDFGVTAERNAYKEFVLRPARYKAQPEYSIEPDASAASYFFAAPAICGGTVRVKGISRQSKQGDIAFLAVLERMGCAVTEYCDGISVSGPTELLGVRVDMRDFSDTAQTLAVIAPFANSPTEIRGISSSRVKETDRITAVCTELTKLGVKVDEHPDGMTIFPCREFQAGEVETYKDHRMAMAFSLIGLRSPGIRISDPECVSKTFPSFYDVLADLR